MKAYNVEKLEELIKDLYNLTGMKICIYDNEENELCFYPKKLSNFCALVRSDKTLNERCAECDRQAFAICKKTRKQYSYSCHAGLLECVSPVLHADKIIGYIVLGQIKSSADESFNRFCESLPESKRIVLSEVYKNITVTDEGKISSAMHILDACTGYEYLKSLMNSDGEVLHAKIDDYISENIRGDLSVRTICRTFRLSHSEIYALFKEYFDSTPAEYIKARRLSYACKLLRETANPINEIAKQCGIGDYNYFSKKFKSEFGKSPREYRRTGGEK